MTTIKLVSWNVKGISNKTKRYKIITHLKPLESDVAMLQETHLKNAEAVKLRQRWVGQVFSAPGTGASRWVSTLIAKRLSFKLTQEIADKDGRYIIISGFLQNIKCTLVNVYAPNTGQAEFLSRLNMILAQFSADPIFMGGDFNLEPVLRSKIWRWRGNFRFNPGFTVLRRWITCYRGRSPW